MRLVRVREMVSSRLWLEKLRLVQIRACAEIIAARMSSWTRNPCMWTLPPIFIPPAAVGPILT